MKKNNRFVSGFVLGMFAAIIVFASIGMGLYFSGAGSTRKLSDRVSGKINYLDKMIDAYYLDDVDKDLLETSIYKGLVAGLGDPYSAYYTAKEYSDLMEDATGKYCGIGVMVSQNVDTGDVTVVKVFEGSPADKSGMKKEDVIHKVEGKDVTGLQLEDVVALIKGDEATEVNVTVYRASQKKDIDLKIVRGEINVPTVSYKILDKKHKVGYVQITQFEEVTYEQFARAIADLKKQGMKAVVFDIRDNPGGLYDTVCKVLDDLLPEGTIVYTKDKYGTEEKKTSNAKCLNIPMVVLQNGNSASASEIFAGAIQDFGVGKIVGEQSFGKGIVQSIFSFDDGSAVKLTIEKYYTPNGKNIHGKGITPDVKIKPDSKSDKDVQLEKAKEIAKSLIK